MVVVGLGQGLAVDELACAGGRGAFPEGANVVQTAVLVEDRRGDGQLFIRMIADSQAQDLGVREIGALVDRRGSVQGRVEVLAIDIAALMAVPGAEAKAEHVLDDRTADRQTRLIGGVAAIGPGKLRPSIGGVGLQVRLGRDEPDRAAFGTAAEQGALRSAQDLHPVKIEHQGVGVGRRITDHAGLDRRVVNIDAGGGRSDLGINAPDGDVGLGAETVRVELNARRQRGDVLDSLDPANVERLFIEGHDALGDFGDRLGLTGRGDDNLADRGDLVRRGLRQGAARDRKKGRRRQQSGAHGQT